MRYLFTDRFGGVSKGGFESLNLAFHVGDDPLSVEKNRAVLSRKIGSENLVFMDQVHGSRIEVIRDSSQRAIPKCDAMITDIKDLALCVMVADCIPILFYDEKKEVIGAAHAGRCGVSENIANKTIEKMKEEYGCKIEDIKVYLGPSIRSCCYEVKKDVTDGFENYVSYRDEKLYLDINQKCVDDISKIGIKEQNIENSDICTCCDDRYFSYRRDARTGRFCGVIVL